MAKDIQSLLLRLEIQSSILTAKKADYRLTYHVIIQGLENQLRFLKTVGISDRRSKNIPEMTRKIKEIKPNPNNDIIPKEIWQTLIFSAKEEARMTWREFAADLNMSYCGSSLFKNGLSRERLSRVNAVLEPRISEARILSEKNVLQKLQNISKSDVYWDAITEIKPMGTEEVYDITVQDAHNFIANDIIVHNSLEQEADVVMFLHRKDRERTDLPEEEQNLTEIIIAKHRNGPLGAVKLRFDPDRVCFRNIDTYHSSGEE